MMQTQSLGTLVAGIWRCFFKVAFAIAIGIACLAVQTSQAQTFVTLHGFTGSTDGGFPSRLILDSSGNLYGTTYQGGDYHCDPANPGRGCGVVYRMDTEGNETVLFSFRPLPDAEFPSAGLVQDSAGNLYGTTEWGGASNFGTIFKLDRSGKETVLYSFTGGKDGRHPAAGLVLDRAGNLYGTTTYGGNLSCVIKRTEDGCGVVFKLNKYGKETVLHRFVGTDGGWPMADLLRDSQGNFYGTTTSGTTNAGTAFKISHTGQFSVLHRFGGNLDGYTPHSELIRDSAGNLYGTTESGGVSNYGTVYRIDTTRHETILHNFTLGADGGLPDGGLILDADGNLYGTTALGGDPSCNGGSGCGTIFKLNINGTETVLHNFEKKPGEFPAAKLVMDSSGSLYGTTAGDDLANYGSVFKLIP
jgi:uncharacterized repeat protein (TIGR03803 family)